jgi:hypothetical protein
MQRHHANRDATTSHCTITQDWVRPEKPRAKTLPEGTRRGDRCRAQASLLICSCIGVCVCGLVAH